MNRWLKDVVGRILAGILVVTIGIAIGRTPVRSAESSTPPPPVAVTQVQRDAATLRRVSASVVEFGERAPNGTAQGICTAWAFAREGEDAIFGTASHCVMDDEKRSLRPNVGVKVGSVLVPVAILDPGDQAAGNDFAVFKAHLATPPLPWGDDTKIPSDALEAASWRLFSVSANPDLGRVYLNGGFYSRALQGSGRFDGYMILSMGVFPGNSGSPLYANGGVIGIVVASFHEAFAVAMPVSMVNPRWRK